MAAVFRTTEVSLFGTYFPIVGPIQQMLASQFAPKQVTGDYSKDSEQIASSWILQDSRGGIGIKDMMEVKDADRCWWSTAEIGYKGHLLLPVLVTNCGNPTAADPAVIIEYGNALYVAFGADVRKWNEGLAAFGSSLVTLVAAPTDGIVHKSKLYLAMGTDFERFDGSTWTDGATLSGVAKASRYFIEWDSKLFRLDNNGALFYSTNEGVTWTASAVSTLPAGYFTSLFLYRDVAGDVIVYLGTKQGIYALDFVSAKWVETELVLPYHDYAAMGATWWRDAAYIGSGMALYRYVTSNPAVVSLMGLDRDYGLPSGYVGNIIKLLPGHNALYALMDATTMLVQDLYPAGLYGDVQIYDNEGYSAVFRWDTFGWGVVYLGIAAGTPVKTGVVCTADDYYRLWFAMDNKVFYVPLQVTIQNPLEVADFLFGASAEHITPWFDADNAVIDKLGFKANGYVTGTSATEYAKLYYGLNYDDSPWTLLTTTAFPDGQIDADGEVEFTFASLAGVAFKAIRFKVELARGGTTSVSPDLRWLRLSYIKLLAAQWGFRAQLDCSRNYRFKSAKSLLAALKTAVETQTLGAFTFRNGNGAETHQVRIASLEGVEVGGKRSEGIYSVALVAP